MTQSANPGQAEIKNKVKNITDHLMRPISQSLKCLKFIFHLLCCLYNDYIRGDFEAKNEAGALGSL
jgi:hypothetical protein